MDLELFKCYATKDSGQRVTVTGIHNRSWSATWRVDVGNRHWTETSLMSSLEQRITKELTEPGFDFHHLSLLEAMEICKDPKRPEELRYMYNIDDKQWYHLSASGQFHQYSKVPCEDKCYWVTAEITLELIKSVRWCVPNTVFGYVPLATGEYTYHNFT